MAKEPSDQEEGALGDNAKEKLPQKKGRDPRTLPGADDLGDQTERQDAPGLPKLT